MDEKKNNNDIDSVYDSLNGYFPSKYDRSPEDLEKDIEIENKERKLALSMTMSQREKEALAMEEKKAAEEAEKTTAAAPVSDIVPDVPEEISDITEVVEAEDLTPIEPEPVIPVAESVENNDLLNKYDSLDELFEDLEKAEDEEEDATDDSTLDENNGSLRKTVNWFFDFLEVFAVCMTCIILLFSFVLRLTKVQGNSMNDTLKNNEYLLISNLFYTPEPGDIVVIQNTELQGMYKEPLVKRVIAVAGQQVSINNEGVVTVTDKDGTKKTLDEPYAKYETPFGNAYESGVIEDGYVFVMGDNRNNSGDSRRPEVGPIDTRCIFGKAIVRAFPFNDITFFKNPHNTSSED